MYRSKDFRPSFSQLSEVRSLIPAETLCMACTATATKSVRHEVIESLEIRGCIQFSVSPDRPNIFYEVRKCTNIEDDMLGLVQMLKPLGLLNEHAPYKRGVARPEKWDSQKYKTNIKWPPIHSQQIRPPNTAYTYTV